MLLTPARLPDAPYVRVTRRRDGFHLDGDAHQFLGHQILSGAGDRPDGVFAGWAWNGQTLNVFNDRYGCSPLFYGADSSSIAVSPSITRLLQLGAKPTLDFAALSVFLRMGYFLGDDTPFAAVRALPPAASLCWPRETVARGSLTLPKPLAVSHREAVAGFIELFRTAIARRPPLGPFVVPLSGGRDSRHILFELIRQGHRPESCITYHHFPPDEDRHCTPRPEEDVRVAALIAAAVDVPHEILSQPCARIRRELRKNALTSFCAGELVEGMVLADHLDRREVLVYDGIGGDVWSSGLCFDAPRMALLESGRLREIAQWLLGRREKGLEQMLKPATLREMSLELAIERVAAELQRHVGAADPPESFLFWNRIRRQIALGPYGLLRRRKVYSPYLDHDLFDFLASLPAALMVPAGIHTDAILEAYPRYAGIPFEDWSGTPREDHGHWRRMTRALAAVFSARPHSSLVRVPFLLPLLHRCALDAQWNRVAWLRPLTALYLLQLEELTNG